MSVELQGVIQRLDKLEQDHRDSRDILIEIRTTLGHLDEKLNVQNDRINKRENEIEELEEDVAEIKKKLENEKGREEQRKETDDRRFKKWGVLIIAAEIVVAVIVAVGIKLLWD